MRRVLTSLVLIPIVVYVIFLGHPLLFQAVVALFGALCFHEYRGIAQAQGVPVPAIAGHVAGLALLSAPSLGWLPIVCLLIAAMALALRVTDLKMALPQASFMIAGILYTYGAWRCAPILRARGAWWIFFAVSINWVGDTAAYYCGRTFGKHKMSPAISPAKTWEGAFGAVIFSMIYGVLVLGWAEPGVPRWTAALLSAGVNIAGQLGDLVESALKRGAGVKDSGHMLPGHGGWLDRLDSTLFTMPAVAAFLSLQ